jgi:hypothetical protein
VGDGSHAPASGGGVLVSGSRVHVALEEGWRERGRTITKGVDGPWDPDPGLLRRGGGALVL